MLPENSKPQQSYLICSLKKKLRLLGDELQQLGIPSIISVDGASSPVFRMKDAQMIVTAAPVFAVFAA